MTAAEAQTIQNNARARDAWLIWFVSASDAEQPGNAVAWAIAADPHGATRLPGLLVADTLDELRAMLPTGLTRMDRAAVMGPDVVETWD